MKNYIQSEPSFSFPFYTGIPWDEYLCSPNSDSLMAPNIVITSLLCFILLHCELQRPKVEQKLTNLYSVYAFYHTKYCIGIWEYQNWLLRYNPAFIYALLQF